MVLRHQVVIIIMINQSFGSHFGGKNLNEKREQMIQMALDNLEAGLEDRPLLASV